MKQIRRVLPLLLGAVALVGCSRMGIVYSDDGQRLPAPAGRGLVAKADSPIPDVPHPIGFVLVQPRSKATVSSGVRAVEHVYQGQASMSDVVSFYRQVLPRHSWRINHEDIRAGSSEIAASRGGEQLELKLSVNQPVVTVVLSIWGVGQSGEPAEADSPPRTY